MTDTVAIVSVISSGVVGLAGVGVGVYGAAAARRWQTREERATELRSVLDSAALSLAKALQLIGEAHAALTSAGIDSSVRDEATSDARSYLADEITAHNQLWETMNRVSLRKGPDSPVAKALNDAETQVGLLGACVRRGLSGDAVVGYREFWGRAVDAEKAFYRAAQSELGG